MPTIEYIQPESLWRPETFTQVVTARANRLIFISGQAAFDVQGRIVGVGSLGEQTTHAFRNLGLALSAAGVGFAEVIKLTLYVVAYQPEYRRTIVDIRNGFFPPGRLPAVTLVGVLALARPELLIEIDAVAAGD